MPFGSRRFLSGGSGRVGEPTEIIFKGGVRACTIAEISNDSNGNTVLGNGSFNSFNNLRTNIGTGSFSNAPMVVELTPGRNYIIKIIRDQSMENDARYVPQVDTNVAATDATLDVFYGNLTSLSNPPEQNANSLLNRQFDQEDISSLEPVLRGPNDGSGNPTPPARFTFEDAGWINNEIVLAEGFSVDNSHDDFLGLVGGGSNHTAKGLYCRFNVAQASNGATARVKVTVQEGLF